MKIMVTGCAGLIGSYVVDKCLEKGHQVIGVDNLSRGSLESLTESLKNSKFKFYRNNILDTLPDIGNNIDVMIHMAAVVPTLYFYTPSATFDVNVIGTRKMLEFAKQHRCKTFIHGSSSEIYGIPSEYPTSESHPSLFNIGEYTSRWSYAAGKLMTEYFVNECKDDMKVINMRFANVYGERDMDDNHVIPIFINSLMNSDTMNIGLPVKLIVRKAIEIDKMSRQVFRTFVHGEDCAEACILAAESKEEFSGNVYNVASKEEISIYDLLLKISRLVGVDAVFTETLERPGNPKRRLLDIRKAEFELGWAPKISLDVGLKRMIAHKQEEMKN